MADKAPSKPSDLPPELAAPLAHYGGGEPPAPQWFKDALAQAPERSFVDSLGSKLEVLTWGQVGKPGLLFIHGNSAHADWWSFIAPFFAADFRVAALSSAGSGASDWRPRYSFDDASEDLEAVARAAGLYEGGTPPSYVAHSFGGIQAFYAALRHPQRMRAGILVDSGFGPPPEEIARRDAEARAASSQGRVTKVYPTLEAALARFRLMPPQPVGEPCVADFIARRSLKRAPLPDGSGEGWTWRFDPNMWGKLDRSGAVPSDDELSAVRVPLVHVIGAQSAIVQRLRDGRIRPFPPQVREIEIPEARHHIMIDQPLALVSTIRALLTVWPDGDSARAS